LNTQDNIDFMKILFFGDIVGSPGREALKKVLPSWKKEYKSDLVIANGENAAHGRGITKETLTEILKAGVDLVTLGDHTWDKKEVVKLLEDGDLPLLRPANFPKGLPGRGYCFVQVGVYNVLIINLIGRVFMHQQYDDPFKIVDEILEEEEEKAEAIIVDWHTEATSEKVCLGWHLDGRVSAVLGTHTHIPTADGRILPQGTAYISDVGMVGARDSSLGSDKDIALKIFLTQINQRMEIGQGPVRVDAVLVEIDKSGKAVNIKQLQKTVEIG